MNSAAVVYPISSIIFLCKGNTCRSPMAEALARKAFNVRGLTGIRVESAGIGEYARGKTAHEYSVVCMARRGIDISGHQSRWVDDIEGFATRYDLYIPIDPEADAGLKQRGIPADKIVFIDIVNPWEKGPDAYDACADEIEEKVNVLAASLWL